MFPVYSQTYCAIYLSRQSFISWSQFNAFYANLTYNFEFLLQKIHQKLTINSIRLKSPFQHQVV